VNCAEARDLAPELALGVLGGAERAEVLLHVNGCARCQATVAELTDVADALVTVAPEAEPSRGFEQRVLTEIAAPRRGHRRRFLTVGAIAAAIATIVSITIVRVVESGDAAQTAAPVRAEMIDEGTNMRAGWASVADAHAVTISVDYGVPSGHYAVEVQPAQGGTVRLGAMRIDEEGRGFWTGNSDVPIAGASTLLLVDRHGDPACHGTLGAQQ
jgi:hypothetical protein